MEAPQKTPTWPPFGPFETLSDILRVRGDAFDVVNVFVRIVARDST